MDMPSGGDIIVPAKTLVKGSRLPRRSTPRRRRPGAAEGTIAPPAGAFASPAAFTGLQLCHAALLEFGNFLAGLPT